ALVIENDASRARRRRRSISSLSVVRQSCCDGALSSRLAEMAEVMRNMRSRIEPIERESKETYSNLPTAYSHLRFLICDFAIQLAGQDHSRRLPGAGSTVPKSL